MILKRAARGGWCSLVLELWPALFEHLAAAISAIAQVSIAAARPVEYRRGETRSGCCGSCFCAPIRLSSQMSYGTRPDDRRVGTEWVRSCISLWGPHHVKNKKQPK